MNAIKASNSGQTISPLTAIGSVALLVITNFISYKLGKRKGSRNDEDKEITLIGSPEAEDHLCPKGVNRNDLTAIYYVKMLLESELPRTKETSTLECKHMANIDMLVTRVVLVLENSRISAETKNLTGRLKSINTAIKDIYLINRTTTLKFLYSILHELKDILQQTAKIIDSM